MLFDKLFEENSIIKQAIQEKISEEIKNATAEKDKEIAELKETVKSLVASNLGGI